MKITLRQLIFALDVLSFAIIAYLWDRHGWIAALLAFIVGLLQAASGRREQLLKTHSALASQLVAAIGIRKQLAKQTIGFDYAGRN